MKVTCDYCGAFVEAEAEAVCPHCGASLAEPIRRTQSEAQAREKEQREEAWNDKLLETFAAVAVAAAGGGRRTGFLGRLLRRLVRKYR